MNILLIDDHPLILSALRIVVAALGEDVGVATAASAVAARDVLAREDDFDLALLDLQLGEGDGFGLLTELRTAHPALPIVIVAASDRRVDVLRAIDLGAMGFVSKAAGNETLLQALRMVLAGEIYLPPQIMRSGAGSTSLPNEAPVAASWGGGEARAIDGEHAQAAVARLGLTRRQSEVLALLLKGQSNKLIARALNLSVETIKDHVAAVLRALKVSSRTQAVLAVSEMSNPGALLRWRASSSSSGTGATPSR